MEAEWDCSKMNDGSSATADATARAAADEETEAVPPGTLSYCELVQLQGKGDQVGEAMVFVSHAWKYKFSELVAALESEFGGTDTKLWFDIATVNEHTGMDGLEGDWASTFKIAVKTIGSLTLVLSPWDAPIPMTRSWYLCHCRRRGCPP